MVKEIWFDMDGTLADLYGVDCWLEMLRAESPIPYLAAKPLVNMQSLARIIHRLQRNGYKVGIVSWLSKVSSSNYDRLTIEAKRKWLETHLKSVQFDALDFLAYGEPKHDGRNGILFDDNAEIRRDWGEGAFDETDILNILKGYH